jgi:hypothetical protein
MRRCISIYTAMQMARIPSTISKSSCETNIEFLRTLPRSAGGRKARHKVAGEITLQQMLHEWAMHDLGHIRQIAELVRARKHWQAAGRLGSLISSGREKHRYLAVAAQL